MELTTTTIRFSRNGHSRRTKPAHGDLGPQVLAGDADARYDAALNLVQAIDRDLQKGTRHYYDGRGHLLVSLDEVIQAILHDNLVVGRREKAVPEVEPMCWPVGELVA